MTNSKYADYRDAMLNARVPGQIDRMLRAAEADKEINCTYMDKLQSLASQRKRQLALEGYCWRRKCIYWRNPNRDCVNSCNYMIVTGHSRIAQIPDRKLRRDFQHCPLFDSKKPEPKERIPSTQEQTKYDWIMGRALYDAGMTDREIAAALGCTQSAVKWWRRRRSLPVNKEKDKPDETM